MKFLIPSFLIALGFCFFKAEAKGVAIWKEQQFHEDHLAKIFLYDTYQAGVTSYRFICNGKEFSIPGAFQCIDFIPLNKIYVRSDEEANKLRIHSKKLEEITIKYPKTKPFLTPQIKTLNTAIENFKRGIFTSAGEQIEKADYIKKNSVNSLSEKDFILEAENGNVLAQFELAKKSKLEGKKEDAFKWFKKAADQNYVKAQLELADCYLEGIGTTKNNISAFDWLKKAADLNDSEAQFKIGVFFETGIGVSRNSNEALVYYKKSANQGNANAQFITGNFYETGTGTEKDLVVAFKWFKKAAEQNHLNAEFKLAKCYDNGIGTEKNIQKAISLYEKSAKNGNPEALFLLGKYYLDGFKVPKNEERAIPLLEKAKLSGHIEADRVLQNYYEQVKAERRLMAQLAYERDYFAEAMDLARKGIASAQCEVGACYANGYGVTQNNLFAMEWYRKAANQGHSAAYFLLGKHYLEGNGVTKDRELALTFISKAASLGHCHAIELLKKLRSND